MKSSRTFNMSKTSRNEFSKNLNKKESEENNFNSISTGRENYKKINEKENYKENYKEDYKENYKKINEKENYKENYKEDYKENYKRSDSNLEGEDQKDKLDFNNLKENNI